jgi:hypothetical protein
MELHEQKICSRCGCRRPIEQFTGARCRRCTESRKRESERNRLLRHPELAPKPKARPDDTEGLEEASKAFSRTETSSRHNLALRVKQLLRRKLPPTELADRLVTLARSGDERIASSTLEIVLALQGVVIPKKVEEATDQRFFLMSSSLSPKIDTEVPTSEPVTPSQPEPETLAGLTPIKTVN